MAKDEVGSYIDQFNDPVRERLRQIRALMCAEVPDAHESFVYGLIGYKLYKKPLIYFGGFKNHVGFYATPNGHSEFIEEFSRYKQGKGSVQFPNDQPLPLELIEQVVRYRKKQIGG